MRLKALISCIVCIAGYGAGTLPALALPNVSNVARQVDERYNHLQTLTADVRVIFQGSVMERTESGTLWLKKPGKMRWEYRSPEEKLFVDDGRDGWLYLPAEKQARKSSMKKLEDIRSPLAFLLGKTKLEKELAGLSFAPDLQTWHPDDVILRGIPRGMEDALRQVVLEITPEHAIVRILLYGTDDSITEYRFSNQKENVALPDAKFRFSPPPGTEVIVDAAGNQAFRWTLLKMGFRAK
jgi:outer membrane lipoprotein carrier protein